MKPTLTSCCRLAAIFLTLSGTLRADNIIHDKDRIVFCGDSITGQGGHPGGWVSMIGDGLTLAHPDQVHTLTALGGSGSTVGAWQNFEKRSQTQPVFLDLKDVDVKATLDGGADVLVIMLGMNDVLSPSLRAQPADYDAWAAKYHDLIESLKARAHPRVVALATITPCTEDNDSPKNQVEAELNARLAVLAKQEGAIVLPTHEAMLEFLNKGRSFKPDFHITVDYVHPAPAGHLAIAAGMLRGLGESAAADQLINKRISLISPGPATLPTLSWTLKAQPGTPDDAKQNFTVHFHWTPSDSSGATATVTAKVPEGWQVTPASITGAEGDFHMSGPLDRLVNKITLHAAGAGDVTRDTEIDIPAGWRVATGPGKALGWTNNAVYDPTKDHVPFDDLLSQDSTYLSPAALPSGDTAPWKLYIASQDFTGRGAPGSVDMAAVNFFHHADLAYGIRWIHSDKDHPVDVSVGSQAFASMAAVSVMLNGTALYQGIISKAPGRKVTVEGKLVRGWNQLVFRGAYIQWQWQFSVDVAGKAGDDLADVRYSTAPPPGTKPAPSPAAQK